MSPAETTQPLALHIDIFTFKEGLLARAAHDLRLHVTRSSAVLTDGARLSIEIDAHGIVVDGAMRAGKLLPDELSLGDRREIERNLQDTVLETSRYPHIRFTGAIEPSQTGTTIRGELEIRGQRRSVATTASGSGSELRTEFEIRPSQFGITPFRALLGAIRLQDRVLVKVHGLAAPVKAVLGSTSSNDVVS